MTISPLAPCRLGISGDTLSAYRDRDLAPAEIQTVRAHIPTCAACQARLAAFDRVAQALRAERDLEPDGRIWATLHPRIIRKEHAAMNPRSIISGGIAALSVIIIVALFAVIFVNHRGGGPATATATLPPGQTTTPPTKPTPLPTGVPGTLSGLLTASQVWGTTGATVNTGSLTVGGITPDGQHILGYQPSADGKNYDIGWLSVATGRFTTFDQSPINGTNKPSNPPNCCTTDGRFIMGANGTSEGASTNAPWYYDTQTGQLHPINSNEFFVVGMHDGVAYHTGLTSSLHSGTLYGLNLLTGQDTPIVGNGAIVNVLDFAWPDFLYTTQNADQINTTLHAHDLQTGAEATLAPLGNVDSAAIVGDTVFAILLGNTGNHLNEWDHVFTAGSVPKTAITLLGQYNVVSGANARVALVRQSCVAGTSICEYGTAWDRTLGKLVLLSPSTNVDMTLVGDYFILIDHTAHTVTLYNSATFPTQ